MSIINSIVKDQVKLEEIDDANQLLVTWARRVQTDKLAKQRTFLTSLQRFASGLLYDEDPTFDVLLRKLDDPLFKSKIISADSIPSTIIKDAIQVATTKGPESMSLAGLKELWTKEHLRVCEKYCLSGLDALAELLPMFESYSTVVGFLFLLNNVETLAHIGQDNINEAKPAALKELGELVEILQGGPLFEDFDKSVCYALLHFYSLTIEVE
jgi:hypothetical protein